MAEKQLIPNDLIVQDSDSVGVSSTLEDRPVKTVYVKTWGCQMNDYDSKRLYELMEAECNLQPVQRAEDADVVLFNTCSVREKPQEKLFSEIGRIKHLRRQVQPQSQTQIFGVGGCVASQEGEKLFARDNDINFVFGPQTLHRTPKLLKQALDQRNQLMHELKAKGEVGKSKYPSASAKRKFRRERSIQLVDITFPEMEKFDSLPTPSAEAPMATLSIMEGCSKYCSFCVVPYTRGEEFSRPSADILAEAKALEMTGASELMLLGQNVNAWEEISTEGVRDLAWLLAELSQLKRIQRLRFTTSHPLEMKPSLIEAFHNNPKLAQYLHLPVQSGSNKILEKMKRGYTAQEYLAIIEQLRSKNNQFPVATDIIVGFPGETESDFSDTMDLVDTVGFDRSFSFCYSKRPGTPAALLPNQVSPVTAKTRLQLLQEKLNAWHKVVFNSHLGTVQRALVTGISQKRSDDLCAHIDNLSIVNFPCKDLDLIGSFVDLEITSVNPNSLRGRLI